MTPLSLTGPALQFGKDLPSCREAEVQSKRTSPGDDLRPIDIGVGRVSARDTAEPGLRWPVVAADKPAARTFLGGIGGIDLGGLNAETVPQIGELGPERGSAAVGENAVEPAGEPWHAEVEALHDELGRRMEIDDAVERGVDPGFDNAPHLFGQSPIAQAVARFAARTHAMPRDRYDLAVDPAHRIEEPAAHQVAAIGGHECREPEVHSNPLASRLVGGPACGEGLRHVGHQANAEAALVRNDLEDVAALALPFPPIGVAVQGDRKCLLTDEPERRPEIAMTGAGGRCNLGHPNIEHRGDAASVRPAVALQDGPHDASRQVPDPFGERRVAAPENDVIAAEPCLLTIDRVQHVLHVAWQAGPGDGLAELVLPVGEKAPQHGRDLGTGHLCRRRSAEGIEAADIAVFAAEPASLEESTPLARGNRRGTGAVTAAEGQHPLAFPAIGRVPDRVGPDHATRAFQRRRGARDPSSLASRDTTSRWFQRNTISVQ